MVGEWWRSRTCSRRAVGLWVGGVGGLRMTAWPSKCGGGVGQGRRRPCVRGSALSCCIAHCLHPLKLHALVPHPPRAGRVAQELWQRHAGRGVCGLDALHEKVPPLSVGQPVGWVLLLLMVMMIMVTSHMGVHGTCWAVGHSTHAPATRTYKHTHAHTHTHRRAGAPEPGGAAPAHPGAAAGQWRVEGGDRASPRHLVWRALPQPQGR